MRPTFLRAVATACAAAITLALAPALGGDSAAGAPGDVVLTENFDSGTLPEGWRAATGTWSVRDGKLVVDGGSISRLTFGPHLTNYRVEADITFEQVANSSRWAGIMLDAPTNGAVPWWQGVMRTTSTASNGIEFAERTATNSWNVPFTGSAPRNAGTGRPVHVAIEVQGSRAKWFFDGTLVLEGRINRTDSGVLGFVADGSTVTYDNVKVTELEPLKLTQGDGAPAEVIAHRGYSAVNPENSLAAMVAGARSGAVYVETDVHTSADGVPVIMHDQTVNRTTTGTGDVARMAASAITNLPNGTRFSPAFSGQRVPTLAELLDTVKAERTQLLLEIKGPETSDEVRTIVELIRAKRMTGDVVVQSFDENVLRHARTHAPEIKRGLLRGSLDADPMAKVRELDLAAYNPSAGALGARQSLVEDLNAQGVAVMVWTVDGANDWKRLSEMGVDGIITNRPGALVGWQAAQKQVPAPTVSFVSPANGSTVERGDDVVVAASTTDATEITLTLDGRPTSQSVIPASGLTLGEHQVVANVTGQGGDASATSTFSVTVTQAGLRGRLAGVPVTTGQLQQLMTAVNNENWTALATKVEAFVPAGQQRDALLEEIAWLAR